MPTYGIGPTIIKQTVSPSQVYYLISTFIVIIAKVASYVHTYVANCHGIHITGTCQLFLFFFINDVLAKQYD